MFARSRCSPAGTTEKLGPEQSGFHFIKIQKVDDLHRKALSLYSTFFLFEPLYNFSLLSLFFSVLTKFKIVSPPPPRPKISSQKIQKTFLFKLIQTVSQHHKIHKVLNSRGCLFPIRVLPIIYSLRRNFWPPYY